MCLDEKIPIIFISKKATHNWFILAFFQFAQADDDAGVPGCLFGRYPGDVYAGGNPWPLLTAAAAEVLFGQTIITKIIKKQLLLGLLSGRVRQRSQCIGPGREPSPLPLYPRQVDGPPQP